MLIYLKIQDFVIKKIKKIYNYDHILNNYLLYVAIREIYVAASGNVWQ